LGSVTLQKTAINLLREMVETPSVSGEEETIASLLREKMTGLEYSVSVDSVGNVIGQIGEGSPHVLLCGHMDTVPGEIPVTFKDGILKGRGSVDAKGPLASFIVGSKQAFDDGFQGTLTVVGAVDEEGSNRGIKELIKHDLDVDYAIFGEPTNVHTLTIGYKGGVLFKIDVNTETGHSSAPWMFTNAIEAGMDLFRKIKAATSTLTEETKGFNALTGTIRKIQGGGSFGMVPGDCKMMIGFRVPPSVEIEGIIQVVGDTIENYVSDKVSVEYNVIGRIEPYLADSKSLLVKAFTRTIYSKTREKVTLVRKSGTGDMNYYGSYSGIPCVTYGPGNPHLDHTDDEHILIDDYLHSIEIVKQALLIIGKIHQ
jgi:LysW-gamma-L-lysine carboxypeptidase